MTTLASGDGGTTRVAQGPTIGVRIWTLASGDGGTTRVAQGPTIGVRI